MWVDVISQIYCKILLHHYIGPLKKAFYLQQLLFSWISKSMNSWLFAQSSIEISDVWKDLTNLYLFYNTICYVECQFFIIRLRNNIYYVFLLKKTAKRYYIYIRQTYHGVVMSYWNLKKNLKRSCKSMFYGPLMPARWITSDRNATTGSLFLLLHK